MLKVEDAPDRITTRLISEENREALKAMQRGCGKIVTDNGDGTIKVYDTDGVTLLLTITYQTAGTIYLRNVIAHGSAATCSAGFTYDWLG